MSISIQTNAVERINFDTEQPAPGDLDVRWIHGSISAKHLYSRLGCLLQQH